MLAPTSQKTTATLPRNDEFFGQASRLKEIQAALGPLATSPAKSRQQGGQPPSRQRSCCLHGIGGSGKMSIVLEYIYRHQNCFNHFFWANSEHAAELPASTQESIIITTQAAEIQYMTTSSINLQGLSSDQEGVDMLIKKAAREDVKAVIDLIREIPLAITHTARVINQTGCSLKEFITTIEERRQRHNMVG
ncbi:hypothetical protein CEP54_011978 [Fusarium duplospermum]|uniref:NB-ARC domain-containing protein n=1 Tax=Fusarium duplospermum TaxID=1325734 RepID=A0A428PBB0_9HYPO|nr:hypothetical protein CEP54_011978 [Fusarium duplospermum]